MLWLDTPECCCRNMSERACVCGYAAAFVCWPSRWPQRQRACSRAHLSEPVIASWLQDIWLKCTATDYYYPFLREQFFSLSGRGVGIKLKKIARRINRLPGRQQRRKLGKVDQLYLCVIGVVVNGCSVLNVPVCHTEWVKVSRQDKKQERERDTVLSISTSGWTRCDEPHLKF